MREGARFTSRSGGVAHVEPAGEAVDRVAQVVGGDDVGEREPDRRELAGHELGVGLRAEVDLAVALGLAAVAVGLTVLGEEDQWRGVRSLQGEREGEEDERVRVEPQARDRDVHDDPHDDDDRLDDEEPRGTDRAGDRLGELAERVGVVVDPERHPRPARRAQVVAAPDAPARAHVCSSRQLSGSARSSTSSTVTAPSSRPASSHTGRAMRL